MATNANAVNVRTSGRASGRAPLPGISDRAKAAPAPVPAKTAGGGKPMAVNADAANTKTAGGASFVRSSWGQVSDRDAALRFDNGDAIALLDLLHHTMITGSTGSGKTSNAVVPILDKFIGAKDDKGENRRFPGLILDIKGNLSDRVLALARRHGREKDIVEFGDSDTATQINLLAGMSPAEAGELVRELIEFYAGRDEHNATFRERGIRDACWALELQHHVSRMVDAAADRPQFAMSLATLLEMFVNPVTASRMFDIFANCLHDPDDARQKLLVDGVRNYRFSVLRSKEFQGRKDDEFHNQSGYAIAYVRTPLEEIAGAPNVLANFAAPGAGGLEIERRLREGRIVILRFSPKTSRIGAMFARLIANKFYEAVYNTGLDMPEGRMSFVVMDEFASFCDLSEKQYSDRLFISKAREFRCAFVAATQGISDMALRNRCGGMSLVTSFLNNCNNQIMFRTDDVETRNYVKGVAPHVDLLNLRQSEAHVRRFDSGNRRHVSAIQGLQQTYESTERALRGHDGGLPPAAPRQAFRAGNLLHLVHRLEVAVTPREVVDVLDTGRTSVKWPSREKIGAFGIRTCPARRID